MKTRFDFVALMFGIVLWSASIAVAHTGAPEDVNKDNIIDETDADIVILHINTYGSTNDRAAAVAEFEPWDDEDLADLILLLGAEPVLYDLASIGPTSGDEARVNYCVTWHRNDVNGNGTISAADALQIINWLNSH
jgi:hypothetical protein